MSHTKDIDAQLEQATPVNVTLVTWWQWWIDEEDGTEDGDVESRWIYDNSDECNQLISDLQDAGYDYRVTHYQQRWDEIDSEPI